MPHSNRWRSRRCLFEAVPITTVSSPPSCGLKSYWSPPSPTHRSTGSVSLSDWSTQLDEPTNMDKQARKGKAKGQKGQDDTTDEITIEKGNEPQFLETANDQAGLSDKMDETGVKLKPQTRRPVRRPNHEQP